MCHSFVLTSINLGHVLRDLIRLNCIIMQIVCHYKSLRGLDVLLSVVMGYGCSGIYSTLQKKVGYILVTDSECTTMTLCFKIKVKFQFQNFFRILLLQWRQSLRGLQVSHQRWIWGSRCAQAMKQQVKGSTMALKPRADITRSPKQWT